MEQYDVKKAQQKIVIVMARLLMLAPEAVQVDGRYQDMLHSDLDALRAFAAQVEDALGVVRIVVLCYCASYGQHTGQQCDCFLHGASSSLSLYNVKEGGILLYCLEKTSDCFTSLTVWLSPLAVTTVRR